MIHKSSLVCTAHNGIRLNVFFRTKAPATQMMREKFRKAGRGRGSAFFP